MIDISTKLKELREEKNLTQNDAAQYLHIARNTLSQFETGKARPSYEVLASAADLYSVSVDFLLGREDYFGNYYRQDHTSAGKLTDKERVMLNEFRTLLPEMQDLVITMIKNLHSEKVKV